MFCLRFCNNYCIQVDEYIITETTSLAFTLLKLYLRDAPPHHQTVMCLSVLCSVKLNLIADFLVGVCSFLPLHNQPQLRFSCLYTTQILGYIHAQIFSEHFFVAIFVQSHGQQRLPIESWNEPFEPLNACISILDDDARVVC
jgi:hypothetical protein